MSAFVRAPFGQVAPPLEAAGYQPVPIRPGGKAPMLDDWQAAHPVAHWLPRCASWGTGLLTATTPAIDIDVKDRELVRALLGLADDMLGGAPFRIGQPPKVLLPFATETPFDKISGRWFGLPGENWRAPDYTPHRIEVLGAGQQFVAYAIYPGTRRPYRWARGEPMQIYRVDLPELTAELAQAYVAAAELLVLELGAIPLRRHDKRWRPDLARPEPTHVSDLVRSARGDRSWQSLEPERLAKLLDAKRAARTKGGWICTCPAHHGVGHRSLSITPREGGGSVVHCFADCTFAEIAREIAHIVGSAAA